MRTAAGLSQSQLAASMSARYSVSRYATGNTYLTQLSLERATRIAQALQADLADLSQW